MLLVGTFFDLSSLVTEVSCLSPGLNSRFSLPLLIPFVPPLLPYIRYICIKILIDNYCKQSILLTLLINVLLCYQIGASFSVKSEGLKRGLHSMESSDYQMSESGMINCKNTDINIPLISFWLSFFNTGR